MGNRRVNTGSKIFVKNFENKSSSSNATVGSNFLGTEIAYTDKLSYMECGYLKGYGHMK